MTRADILERVNGLRTGRTPFVLATVVRAERPTSAKPGDCALVLADGTIDGFVGGVCAESTVRLESLRLLHAGESGLLRITPYSGDGPEQEGVRTVGNPCLSGGTLEIFLEAMIPPVLVTVHGEAPVARALVRVGTALDWDVRAGVDASAPISPDTSAVVVASHGRDEATVLRAALEAGVGYVALVASRRRSAGVLAELEAAGVDASRVHAPAGLDIGARTAGEIALSVFADIVAAAPGCCFPIPMRLRPGRRPPATPSAGWTWRSPRRASRCSTRTRRCTSAARVAARPSWTTRPASAAEVYTCVRFCRYPWRCVVAKKLIDIDIELLERAKEILGAETYKETVNAGLREIIATAARRAQIERLLDPEPSDIEDPVIMASAWR